MSDVRGKLAELWLELLKGEEVTADTDFFESGGTSIVAVYLAAGIQESFEVPVDAVEVVTHPRFADLAALLDERLAEAATT